jgi:hypothetical protein
MTSVIVTQVRRLVKLRPRRYGRDELASRPLPCLGGPVRTTTLTSCRWVVSVALLIAASACGDLSTKPTAPVGPPRFDLADSTGAVVTQLLVCPTNETQRVEGVIGPEGGLLGVRGVSIAIPSGAVAEPTTFEVIVPASSYLETEINAIGSEHYVFEKPATVTVNLARCPVGSIPDWANLKGANIDLATYQVLEVMGGTYDKTGHKVVFSTPHLSGYVVAY